MQKRQTTEKLRFIILGGNPVTVFYRNTNAVRLWFKADFLLYFRGESLKHKKCQLHHFRVGGTFQQYGRASANASGGGRSLVRMRFPPHLDHLLVEPELLR